MKYILLTKQYILFLDKEIDGFVKMWRWNDSLISRDQCVVKYLHDTLTNNLAVNKNSYYNWNSTKNWL